MPKKSLKVLTESMFYVLMAFWREEKCGAEVAAFVEKKTHGRFHLGPATLYTLLAKFEKEGYLCPSQVEGRKRTYRITPKGRAAYLEEVERLRRCLADAQSEGGFLP